MSQLRVSHSSMSQLTISHSSTYSYPPDKHPVLVFKGAPARFPVLKENRHLHKYVKWNDRMIQMAEEFFSGTMGGQPYIAVHMRIGSDWVSLTPEEGMAKVDLWSLRSH